MTDFSERFERLARRGRCTVVGVAGGSGSGKTTLALELARRFGPERCGLLAQDSFYIDQSARFDGDGGSVNFDHPDSLDFPLLEQQLQSLKQGVGVSVPVYEFATHQRSTRTEPLAPHPLIIVDGTLILDAVKVRRHFDVGVFVETEEAVRFQRRLERDVRERGRTPEGVHKQFFKQVKPMHDQFVEPSKAHASVLVSGDATVEQGLELVLRALEALTH